MSVTRLLAAAAALSLVAAPAFAAPANPAAKLSLTSADTPGGAPMRRTAKPKASTALIAGVAVAAVVIGAVALSHHDSKAASA
jgi:hypothetical protein